MFREQYREFRKMYTVYIQRANDPKADKQMIDKSYSELVSKALVMAEGVNAMIGQAKAISVQQPTGGGA